MLEVVTAKNPNEKREIFLKEDHSKTAWIVSDLTSKLAFQKEIFKTQKVIPDESLLRAHELWLKLCQRLRGDLKTVSQETAQLLTRKLLQDSDEEWMRRPGVVNLVHQYLQGLMPVLSHENHFDAMKSFFQNNIESFQKWGHWYFLCNKIYSAFLEQKMILPTWASAILVNEVGFEVAWDKKLIFDLGAQMQPLESELILHLSKFLDVKVIVPQPDFFHEYARALKSYDVFISASKKIAPIQKDKIESHVHYEKYSTQLAEVQDLCAKLRKWISNEKIIPEKIAIAAPDIGVYWPVLYEYLKVEGIPFQRKVQTPVKTFPEISQWLAKLKIESGQIDFSNLQLSLYGEEIASDRKSFKRFDQFQSDFANIYSLKDLDRDPSIKSQFSLKSNSSNTGAQDFLKWSLQFWQEEWPREKLDLLIEKIYSDVPLQVQASLDEWVELLEKFSSRIEFTVDDGFREGLCCIDLVSLKDLEVDRVAILGLTDHALRKSSAILISEKDISTLRRDFGYVIAEPERVDLEFDVRWNLENKHIQYLLSYPQTDFDGSQISPSIVWLRGAYLQNQKNDKIPLKIPEKSRWAQIQDLSPQDILKGKSLFEDQALLRIQNDVGEKPLDWKLPAQNPMKLSASQIENYLECPFILAAKKLFALNDLPELDLDIDAQTRGLLLHKVAELITEQYSTLDISDKNLDDLFDQAQLESGSRIYDAELWSAQKSRLKKMIVKYIRFEKEWRQKFPEMIEQYPEKQFQIYIDAKTGELTTKDTGILLRGRIDRIDVSSDQQHCVVIDYKFDASKKSNHGSWIGNDELQLALYSLAIDRGALEKKMDVVGAVYYGFKDLNRSRGFLLEEHNSKYYEIKSKEKLTSKENLYEEVKKVLVRTIEQLSANNYKPEPQDQKSCSHCHWREICRAPHLNQ